MVDLRYEVQSERVLRRLRKVPDRVREEGREALRDIGAKMTLKMQRDQFGPYRGRAYANRLQARSGAGRRSFTSRVNSSGDPEVRIASSGAPYMRVHEEGGVITGNPWLKIPLPPALTASGQVSRRANLQKGTFIYKSRAGNLLIARRRGQELENLFVLKKSVRIKPRLGFVDTWNGPEMESFRQKRLGLAVKRAVRGVR